ncbi:hypothetical protein CHC165_07000 [Helicobacter pylori]|uniref:hypothetical protein n=1 Tax=Helicobacter pylori TaxID=210 RepID=UPI000EB1DBC4|nr:hypothetical protein [Helicobacter pylori]GHQ27423.1 hypothetical protein VN1218_10380 [Helicobacter pylori]GHR91351.1 hypothetical protein VN1279_06510 [Helicobacter pylori]
MDNNKNNNKNASHLTHEMKNEHGGLAEAGMKADTQPIFKALWGIAQEEAEGYKKALEAKEKAYEIVDILKAINHDNNIIDMEPEDERD